MSDAPNDLLRQFEPNPGVSIQSGITQFMRGLIRLGKLKPDQRLPTTRELAEMWGTQVSIVHGALVPLVKEGLLRRLPRAGTVVQAPGRLSTIGIYLMWDIWREGHGTYRALCRYISSEAADRGMKVEYFIDSRPQNQQASLYEPLALAVRHGHIQAIIAPLRRVEHLQWLKALHVPLSSYGHLGTEYTVGKDIREAISKGMIGLARQGCRTAGFVTVLNIDHFTSNPGLESGGFRQFVIDQAAAAGIEMRPEWMMGAPGDAQFVLEDNARDFGSDCVHRLWQMSIRPAGVLVYTDMAAMGVIDAIIELGIRVPDELALVLHRNEGVPLPCPVPAYFLHVSLLDAAGAMISQVERQYRGESAGRDCIGVSLVGEAGRKRRSHAPAQDEIAAPASNEP